MAYSVLQVRGWSRVSAVVVSTRLRHMKHPRSTANSYCPVVRYKYSVNGTEYENNVVTHGMESGYYQPKAQRIIDQYPVGTTITILHHPEHPQRSCITASFGFFGWVLAFLSLMFVSLAIAV